MKFQSDSFTFAVVIYYKYGDIYFRFAVARFILPMMKSGSLPPPTKYQILS